MKPIQCIVFLITMGLYPVHGQLDPSGPQAKKVVFIIVDGISADQLKAADTPYLDSIAASGAYAQAHVGGVKGSYSETPTVSAVGYNSLLTGTWANKHNVYDNDIAAPNYHYPTIFKLYRDQYPAGKLAVFSSWLDNRTKLLGDGLPATGNLKMDYSYDGLEHDTINFPHDRQRNFMKLIDYSVADRAAKTIVEQGPDVSWVYLQFTDDMGHGFGDSPRFSAAIHFEDALVGKVWQAIKKRQASQGEDWLLVVTTDHGRKEKDGKGHGGQTPRERSTWIVTNAKGTNAYFREQEPGVVDILPSMVDFLGLEVPLDIRREWDGVSFLSPVDMTGLRAKREGRNLILSWKPLGKGKGSLYVSGTNNFKTGGSDNYQRLQKVDLGKGRLEIPWNKLPKGFFKLVLESPSTMLNTWVIPQ